jgi:hypothetical protein
MAHGPHIDLRRTPYRAAQFAAMTYWTTHVTIPDMGISSFHQKGRQKDQRLQGDAEDRASSRRQAAELRRRKHRLLHQVRELQARSRPPRKAIRL